MRPILPLLIVLALCGAANAQTPSAATPRPLGSGSISDAEFAFVRSEGGRRFWLSQRDVARPLVARSIALLDSGAAFAPITALPTELAQLDGKVVRLYSANGAFCEVMLRDWGVFAEFDPWPEGEASEPAQAELAQRAYAEDGRAVLRYAFKASERGSPAARATDARSRSLRASSCIVDKRL